MIMVTGASGFIGGHLARRLIDEGQRLRVLVRNPESLDQRIRTNSEVIVGDLGDTDVLAEAVKGVAVIYHCAANVRTWDHASAYETANVLGTQNLLDAVTRHCPNLARLVHLSTADVYGFPPQPCDEDAPTPAMSFGYGDSKRKAEACIRRWSSQYGFQYTILRPCNVIGQNSQFIDRITAALCRGVMLTVDRGRCHGGFVYVEHLVDYMCWAASAEVAAFQCYNVRDPYDATWADFLTFLRARLPRRGRTLNMPLPVAYIASWLCTFFDGFLFNNSEPILHRLIVNIFGRTCGHRIEKIHRDSGIIPTLSFADVMARCSNVPLTTSCRHFVFLQGMSCGFFRALAESLRSDQVQTTGICLCAGDHWFQVKNRRIHYRGHFEDWPDFIARFFVDEHVTDLILLGEQRPYHCEAIAAASAQNIRIIVTDFGYLRPDWITLERDGMSGNSRFPKNPVTINMIAGAQPEVDLNHKYKDSFARMAIGDIVFNFTNILAGWRYPHYRRTDLRPHPLIYFPKMGLRLITQYWRHAQAKLQFSTYKQRNRSYFILPMQLEHDFQMVAYSKFSGTEELLRVVFSSMAAYAPTEVDLVCKCHPLDPGITRWVAIIDRLAHEYHLTGRIHYIDGGDLGEMIADASGMITVNSTSGIQALQVGCPTLVLGQAIYDVVGMTDKNGLNNFWSNPHKPDKELVQDFLKAIVGTIQIRGVYFRNSGMQAAVKNARDRLNGILINQDYNL